MKVIPYDKAIDELDKKIDFYKNTQDYNAVKIYKYAKEIFKKIDVIDLDK